MVLFIVTLIAIPAGAHQIEKGAMTMASVVQHPEFRAEQETIQQYWANCMGRCHYPDAVEPMPGLTVGGPIPETPLTDAYGEGMADVMWGTVTVVGGVTYLLGMSPPSRSLSLEETRLWYLEQNSQIPGLIDETLTLEEQARQAFELRNYFRTAAREMMADVDIAVDLMITRPNLTWEEIILRKMNQGLVGDDIYISIIGSAQETNQAVNAALGIKVPPRGKLSGLD